MSARSRTRAQLPRRVGVGWLVVALSGAACSFFGPSLDDYAKARPDGAGGSSTPGNGGEPGTAGSAGSGNETSGNSGTTGTAGNAGTTSGEAGAPPEVGGAGGSGEIPEEPDPPDVKAGTVKSDEYRLNGAVTRGLSALGLVLAYDTDEAAVTAPNRDLPRYKPYDVNDPKYWDYLVSEVLQARATFVALPTRGVTSLDPNDLSGPGSMNPRRLSAWFDALGRASVKVDDSAYCLVDTPYLRDVANAFHGSPAGTVMDLALKSDWDDVFWLRAIKPWFDSVPQAAWVDWWGPWIQLGPLPTSAFKNAGGNLSALLTRLDADFQTAYGKEPRFILDASWFTLDPSVASHPRVSGKSPWLEPTTTAQGFATIPWFTVGTIVPGAVDPGYYDPASAHYKNDAYVLPRSTLDAYKNEVVTLATGLSSAIQQPSNITLIQGLNDAEHRAALYASDAEGWASPHRYLNLVRRYADPKTVEMRLEAENCDRYNDLSSGNSGKVFLRAGDLDVRALAPSGWAVTNTAPSEWIEFNDVDFSSGTYRFIARYSTSNSGAGGGIAKRIEVVIDGHKLASAILPDTATSNAFDYAALGDSLIAHGPHQIRLRFMDGFVDLDWLFMHKLDTRLSLKVPSGKYESAQNSGGADVKSGAAADSIFEEFTFDDLNGGELQDGDSVHIQVYNGLYLTVTAQQIVMATAREPGPDGTFQVKLVSGSAVAANGSQIAIVAPDGKHYFTDRADTQLVTTGTSIDVAQTFLVRVY